MFDVSKITHADLGFYDDALWFMYAEIVDRKLVEMMFEGFGDGYLYF